MAISMPEGLNFKLFKRRDLVLQLRMDLDRRCPLMGWRVSAANSVWGTGRASYSVWFGHTRSGLH
jgi:hypothetical protein